MSVEPPPTRPTPNRARTQASRNNADGFLEYADTHTSPRTFCTRNAPRCNRAELKEMAGSWRRRRSSSKRSERSTQAARYQGSRRRITNDPVSVHPAPLHIRRITNDHIEATSTHDAVELDKPVKREIRRLPLLVTSLTSGINAILGSQVLVKFVSKSVQSLTKRGLIVAEPPDRNLPAPESRQKRFEGLQHSP